MSSHRLIGCWLILVMLAAMGGRSHCRKSAATTTPRFMSANYCDADFCPPKKSNVGCGCDFAAPFAAGCVGKSATLHRLTRHEQQLILHQHNQWRNELACGNLYHFPPGARMVQLHWDDELQALAECNVKNCTYGHDQCRSTERFRYAGQNIARQTVCGKELRPAQVFNTSMQVWFSEYVDTKPSDLVHYPNHEPRKPIGHFTLMVNDNVYYLGCALMSYDVRIEVYMRETGEYCRAYYFACNYSFVNLKGQPTYGNASIYAATGSRPARRCRMKPEKKRYQCMCGPREPYSTLLDWEDEVA